MAPNPCKAGTMNVMAAITGRHSVHGRGSGGFYMLRLKDVRNTSKTNVKIAGRYGSRLFLLF